MRHPARSGDARLYRGRDTPPQPARPAGVHDLAEGGLLFVPPSVASGNPLLVFVHGAGGAPASSLRYVQTAATQHGCLVLLPSSVAPTWDVIVGGWGPDIERLDAALAVAADHFKLAQLAVGGFSDGASYALSVGLANGDLVEAVLAFSPGFMVPPDRIGRPRVWISHGTEDAVLRIDRCARPINRDLVRAGYQVSYEEFVGPHVVRPDSVAQAVRWWLPATGSAQPGRG